MKVITLIPRKPGTSRESFRAYYEEEHAPLGARFFPFDKYVRNHLVTSVPDAVEFDVLLESWIDGRTAMTILTSEVEKIFADDEAKFMNAPPRPEGIRTTEHLLAGPPRGVDPCGVRKFSWFLAADGVGRAALLRTACVWAESLVVEVDAKRAILDEVCVGHASPFFKGDAILTLWVGPEAGIPAVPPPAGIVVHVMLELDSQETTTEELTATFERR